jgi:hypothetical protein
MSNISENIRNMSPEDIRKMSPEQFQQYIRNVTPSDFNKLFENHSPIQAPIQTPLQVLIQAKDLFILECIHEIHGVDLFPLLYKVSMKTVLSLYDDNMTYLKLIDKLLKLYYDFNIINKQDETTIINAIMMREHPVNICNFIIMCIINKSL